MYFLCNVLAVSLYCLFGFITVCLSVYVDGNGEGYHSKKAEMFLLWPLVLFTILTRLVAEAVNKPLKSFFVWVDSLNKRR